MTFCWLLVASGGRVFRVRPLRLLARGSHIMADGFDLHQRCAAKRLSIVNPEGEWRRSSNNEKIERPRRDRHRCTLLRSTTLASLVTGEIAVVVS